MIFPDIFKVVLHQSVVVSKMISYTEFISYCFFAVQSCILALTPQMGKVSIVEKKNLIKMYKCQCSLIHWIKHTCRNASWKYAHFITIVTTKQGFALTVGIKVYTTRHHHCYGRWIKSFEKWSDASYMHLRKMFNC